jgi:predicted O-linked N-acetylglucosamine transferase (SPINDLY family)
MGVPVIALAGNRHAARVGVSLLSRIGLNELIAETPEQYVEIACRLSADPLRLAGLRRGLRQRMLASPLCDAPAFTRDLERTYRELWRGWCDNTSPADGD